MSICDFLVIITGYFKHFELCIDLNNVQFKDENCLQVWSTAMGTKNAPSYASLFMGKLEIFLVPAIK